MLKILLLAPFHANLPGAQTEAHWLSKLSGVTVLPPSVTESDIQDALHRDTYDVLWVASHGSESGVLLSRGQYLDLDGLAQYVRSGGVQAVYLGTCDSEDIALKLHDATNADVVAWIGQVEDGAAARRSILFARELVRHGDFRKAFDATHGTRTDKAIYVPSHRKKLPLGAGETPMADEELRERVDDHGERLVRVETRTDTLRALWFGKSQERVPAWVIFVAAVLGFLLVMGLLMWLATGGINGFR